MKVYSVELEANGFADDVYTAETVAECVEYVKDKGYWEDAWRLAQIETDDAGCFAYCYEIIPKEDLDA